MNKDRELTEKEIEQDAEFLTKIIFEIRDYALSHEQKPDNTLRTIAEWILGLLEISTFNRVETEE